MPVCGISVVLDIHKASDETSAEKVKRVGKQMHQNLPRQIKGVKCSSFD